MNIVEGLSREVERVTLLRSAQALLIRAGMEPGERAERVYEMTEAIEQAHLAAGSGDPASIIAAFKRLQGLQP